MATRRSQRLAFALAVALVGECVTSWAADAKGSEGLRIVQAATDAAASALVSGMGEATYKHFARSKKDPSQEAHAEAQLSVAFDRGKYRLEFRYSKHSLKTERQIIVYDGTAIFSNRFTKNIHPVGSHTDVFDVPEGQGKVRPQLAGFPWDVTKLHSSLVDLNRVLKNVSADKIQVILSPEGDYVGQFPSGGNSFVKFECPRKYGFNVGRTSIYGSSSAKPVQEFIATWKKDGDVWYVDTFSEEFDSSTRQERSEMHYNKFTANAKVSPELFTMAALEMPAGSRILDHRPKTAQPIHYVPHEDKALEKQLGTMVEQLQSLPVERPHVPHTAPAPPSPYRRVIFWSTNAAIVLAIVGLSVALWRLRRKRNR